MREQASEVAVRTFDLERALARWHVFEERYGMPFARQPKSRPSGTGRGCRAIVAAAMLVPGSEWQVLRRLQMGYFAGDVYLDDVASIRDALQGLPGVDGGAIADRLDEEDVRAEYERQRADARSATGTPAEAQDKTTISDGLVRYTAPSVVFRRAGETAYAGGWQPLLAYDTLLANFAPDLERVPPPESPEPLLDFFPGGLTPAEVALLLAHGSDPVPDREGAERLLGEMLANGRAARTPAGRGFVWSRPVAVAA